jgi:D-alanyl-D-alanine dipeptidase
MEQKKILTYQDVAAIPSGKSDEPMVDVRTYDPSIKSEYEKLDMLAYTKEIIYVRDSVAQKVASVNKFLKQKGLSLRIVYGYRHPDIQELYFTRKREELRSEYPNFSEAALDEVTHNFVAVPDVGGHPTGGAIDMSIIDSKENLLDMGTGIADYKDPEKMKTFGAGVSAEQMKNRLILHDAMVEENFAPFYGEWWHFSYGDREWACFYEKPTALFGPINFKR